MDPADDSSVGNSISPALLRRLEQNDLSDLAVVLRYRGVKTLRTLASCDSNERAVLLHKGTQLWELVGFFPSNLRTAFNNLFHAEGLPVGESTVASASRIPLAPGIVGPGNNASSSVDSANATIPQLEIAAAANPNIPGQPLIRDLPRPLDDDTNLVKSVFVTLPNARHIIGEQRYWNCLKHRRLSDDAAALSALYAAQALAALRVPKEDVRNEEAKELLKAVKKDVRDFVLRRAPAEKLAV